MASEVFYIRSSRRLSASGWLILHRARQIIEHLPLDGPLIHTRLMDLSAGDRVKVYSSTLRLVFSWIRSINHGYTEEHTELIDQGRFVARVISELLLLQSGQLSAMAHQTCLLCESPVAARMPQQRIPGRVSVERNLFSSCGYWTLQEISLLPIWRGDDRPSLCSWHASGFTRAIADIMGIVDRPILTRRQRRRTFMRSAMQSNAMFDADTEPSS